MNLYLLSQNFNDGYDTHDSCVVAAETPIHAKRINPASEWWDGSYPDLWWTPEVWEISSWAHPNRVTARYLGKAKRGTKPGVICASFNAG